MNTTIFGACAAIMSVSAGTAHAAIIGFDSNDLEALPGSSVSVLVVIEDNTTPLFGYSLDLDIDPGIDAAGTIGFDSAASNFFDTRNLITAGGETRDPVFSVIQDSADGGMFVSTNTSDLSEVTATSGVNDVLAQIVIEIAPDALGGFDITLGPGSVLSTAAGQAVPFTADTLSLTVVPAPATAMLAGLGGLAMTRRRR